MGRSGISGIGIAPTFTGVAHRYVNPSHSIAYGDTHSGWLNSWHIHAHYQPIYGIDDEHKTDDCSSPLIRPCGLALNDPRCRQSVHRGRDRHPSAPMRKHRVTNNDVLNRDKPLVVKMSVPAGEALRRSYQYIGRRIPPRVHGAHIGQIVIGVREVGVVGINRQRPMVHGQIHVQVWYCRCSPGCCPCLQN